MPHDMFIELYRSWRLLEYCIFYALSRVISIFTITGFQTLKSINSVQGIENVLDLPKFVLELLKGLKLCQGLKIYICMHKGPVLWKF